MCNCCNNTDFRNTCWIKNPEYKTCPMRYQSILMRIFEDYNLNNKIIKNGFDSIKEYIMNICDITCEEWEMLKNIYINSGNTRPYIKIQDSVPFQYTPEMTNINLRWLY
jgi:hypothetical protein